MKINPTKTAKPHVNICYLHRELYRLANREGIVEFDLESLGRIIFPDLEINVKILLAKLENYGEITIGKNQIKLTDWPRIGCGQVAPKSERFERGQYIPSSQIAGKDAAKRSKSSRSGLTGRHHSPDFQAFLRSWPLPINPDQKKLAWREWEKLSRSKTLPDISLIILTLGTSPPGPHTWPHTWVKKRPWVKPTIKAKCPTCNDEKIVYGARPDGTKGAIPCPKCNG